MENRRPEDLDMLSLLGSIKLALRKLRNAFVKIINSTFKGIVVIGLSMILGALAGVALYKFSTPFYESQLIINHNRVNNEFCKEMINHVNGFIDLRAENELLAQELQVSPEIARSVKAIWYEDVNENLAKRYQDSTSVLLPFGVKIKVFNRQTLKPMQDALIKYLESNEYAVKRKNIEAQQIREILKRIDREILQIDSLRHVVTEAIIPRTEGTGIILGEPINPIDVYRRRMDLFEKHMNYERKLMLNDSFEVAVGFTESAKRAGAGILTYIAGGLCTGYVFGFLIYRERRRRKAMITVQESGPGKEFH